MRLLMQRATCGRVGHEFLLTVQLRRPWGVDVMTAMTRIPRQLLRISVCLTGGALALVVVLVAAVGSALMAAALMVVRSAAHTPPRPARARPATRPLRAQPATRAEAAL